MKAETENLIENKSCEITDVLQITQLHPIHTCSNHYYTIWSDLDECELYLGDGDTPKVFYITLNPCPLGFKRHTPKEGMLL